MTKCEYIREDEKECPFNAQLWFRGKEEHINHYYCLRHFSDLCLRGLFKEDSYLCRIDDLPMQVETKQGIFYRCYSCDKFLEKEDFVTKAVCKYCFELKKNQQTLTTFKTK